MWDLIESSQLFLVDFNWIYLNVQVAGVYDWKHGRKGSGVYWLQQADDANRLHRIAQQLFDSVGKSISDESFKVVFTINYPLLGNFYNEDLIQLQVI